MDWNAAWKSWGGMKTTGEVIKFSKSIPMLEGESRYAYLCRILGNPPSMNIVKLPSFAIEVLAKYEGKTDAEFLADDRIGLWCFMKDVPITSGTFWITGKKLK